MLNHPVFRLPLVGAEIEAVLFNTEETLLAPLFGRFQREAKRLEHIFNFYSEESELSLLNQTRSLSASHELLEVVERALLYSSLTAGAYDISKGKIFLQRKKGNAEVPLQCTFKDIILRGNHITLNHPDVLVDLGSIAKGYIADKLCELLQNEGIDSALIDARGDMRIFGSHSELLDILHPRTSKGILPFWLEKKAVATSGDYRQFKGHFGNSHILGNHHFSSITVFANTAMDADALATAIFVLPKEDALSLLKKMGNPAVLITVDGNILMQNNVEQFFDGS